MRLWEQGVPPDEVWLGVRGFPPYEVSNLGRVRRVLPARNAPVGKVLAPALMGSGYPAVVLWFHGKGTSCFIHKLVADAFLGPCPEGHQVNHRNGVKRDSGAVNLEYVTPAENVRHAISTGLRTSDPAAYRSAARLSLQDVKAIRSLAGAMSRRRIGRLFGVSGSQVSRIIHHNSWRNVL